ncbi:MAG TPA: NUDIX hydrolase [archaeon]|nr:NUDIX hydrolase [archaeon]
MTIESCADVISLYNGKLVLVNRLKIPKGLAIPGGRLEVNESLEDCALREFREETGLNLKIHKQLGTYSNPSRDPRGQKVSTTFIGEAFGKIKNEKDKTKVILLKLEEIEKNKKFFVFDHYQIIQDFLKSEGIVLLKEDKKAKTIFSFSINNNFFGKVVSDKKLNFGNKERLLLDAYVPGIKIISNIKNYDLIIKHKESNTQKLIVNPGNIEIYGDWKGKISLDLYHLIYGVSRKHYLENNLYSVHSACAGINKNLKLIVGHTGCGKTTVLLELIKKKYKMVSGNKTIVSIDNDKMCAISGTKTITTLISTNLNNAIKYADRTAFQLKKNQYLNSGEVKSIFVININNYNHIEKLSKPSALYRIYPYFLDTVNADTIYGETLIDGTVTNKIKETLVKKLKKALTKINVYLISGSIEYITNKIIELKK